MKKERIDVLLTQLGYFNSRETAKRAIMAGLVLVDQQRIDKPGEKVPVESNITVKGNVCPYVSRGGFKLEKAIKAFNLDLKDKIKDKLVFAKDVKEVLAWTQSGNAEVGFVYYSDTINTDNIKIVETTPSTSHSAIVYPIAVIKESKKPEAAKEFEDFLLSTDGQAILKDFGYKSVE